MLNLKKKNVPNDFNDFLDKTWFTHCQIFDDVLLVSNKTTNCIVLKTSDGLLLIDAIYPAKEMFDAIVSAIKDIGWNPNAIKKFIITHGHFDHTGCGKWIKEAFNPDIYMSEIDYDFWANKPGMPNITETLKDFDVENFIDDGDVINFGDKTIKVFSTPGHTPGGLSFIFPVTDLGVPHMAALWGGTNPPDNINAVVTYFKSLDYFTKKTDLYNVDVALSTHPFIDNTFEKMEFAKNRLEYMPNVFVLGKEGYRSYCQLFRNLCYLRLEGITKQLDD